jgi:hypothetical protein
MLASCFFLAATAFVGPGISEKNAPVKVDFGPADEAAIAQSKENYKKAADDYRDKLRDAQKRLRDAMLDIQKRLAEEDMEKTARKNLVDEYSKLAEKRSYFDSEEDVLQASEVVLWSNRVDKIENLFGNKKGV